MPDDKKNAMSDVLKGAEVKYETKAEKQVKTDKAVEAIKTGIPVMIDAVQAQALKTVILDLAGALSARKDLTALGASVILKKLEGAAETYRTEVLLGAANAEYLKIAAANPASKVIPIEGGLVMKYTPRTSWEYPANIIALEEQLKREKKVAETLKTAKPVTKVMDPSKDTYFSIKA